MARQPSKIMSIVEKKAATAGLKTALKQHNDSVKLIGVEQKEADKVFAAAKKTADTMMSEATNFPDLAAFYQQEVIQPGQALIRRILQRGIERKEFRPLNLDYAVYSIIAPMIYLILAKHSTGVCVRNDIELDPKKYIASQVSLILYGMSSTAPDGAAPARVAP